MKITSNAILPRMKKNPKRVTMLGASHSGRKLTKAFHQCERTYFTRGDLSTLEYLYDLRCIRASSEMHSAVAFPAECVSS